MKFTYLVKDNNTDERFSVEAYSYADAARKLDADYGVTDFIVIKREADITSHADAMNILRGSVHYELCDGKLTVTDYYTGKSFTIDLFRLDEESYLELQPDYDGDDWDDDVPF